MTNVPSTCYRGHSGARLGYRTNAGCRLSGSIRPGVTHRSGHVCAHITQSVPLSTSGTALFVNEERATIRADRCKNGLGQSPLSPARARFRDWPKDFKPRLSYSVRPSPSSPLLPYPVPLVPPFKTSFNLSSDWRRLVSSFFVNQQ